MLKRIFRLKRDEIIVGWRKLHNEKLHNLCSSPNIIRMIRSKMMRWAEHVACTVKGNTYRVLVGKPQGKRPQGRPRNRQEDNIKMDLRGTGLGERRGHGLNSSASG
jgi:hypothetical protein